MTPQLSGSVGRWERGARNAKADVETVQHLLQLASVILNAPELDPHGIDGGIAHPPARSTTIQAIENFQRRFTSAVDGVIPPQSDTWSALVHVTCSVLETAPQPVDSSFCFPFPVIPAYSWEERPRAFASPRDGGSRLHAGCDLYFPLGTPIHAVADGTVVRGPYPFYCQTFALEIDHGSFLARYGEIQSSTDVHTGGTVRAGQRIAKVGHLVGIQVPSDMLHFELYDKSAAGPLTVGSHAGSAYRSGVPFMRRKDLIDPTSHLNEWKDKLSPAV
jgi:murein DD-endopeptidase MepM/ murein hydrolase activator NlpD